MNINFEKGDGLVPVIVQNANTLEVLMLGYMNEEALQTTISTKKVTFYSRSKQRLWTKGETSKNHLNLIHIKEDCDQDALLIHALPDGPTCHTGSHSCFHGDNDNHHRPALATLIKLKDIIETRKNHPKADSYTTKLFNGKLSKIAQKVGEEGLEVALASVCEDNNALIGESVDLLYHLFVLLQAKEITIEALAKCIEERMQ